MDDIVNGIIKVVSMGVSSLDKTESANRTKPKRYPTFSGSDQPNRTNLNRPCWVWFLDFHFEIQGTDEPNRTDGNLTPHFTNIIPPHTIMIWPKIKITT